MTKPLRRMLFLIALIILLSSLAVSVKMILAIPIIFVLLIDFEDFCYKNDRE